MGLFLCVELRIKRGTRKRHHLTSYWLGNPRWKHPCEIAILKEGHMARIEDYWDIGEQTWAMWQGLA